MPKIGSKKWVMVRVQRSTHERLLAVKARLERRQELGARLDVHTTDRHGIPLDDVIVSLLDEVDDHLARGRKKLASRPLTPTTPDGPSAAC